MAALDLGPNDTEINMPRSFNLTLEGKYPKNDPEGVDLAGRVFPLRAGRQYVPSFIANHDMIQGYKVVDERSGATVIGHGIHHYPMHAVNDHQFAAAMTQTPEAMAAIAGATMATMPTDIERTEDMKTQAQEQAKAERGQQKPK